MLYPHSPIIMKAFKYTPRNKSKVFDIIFNLGLLRKSHRRNFQHHVITNGVDICILIKKKGSPHFTKHKLAEMEEYNAGVIEGIRSKYENNIYDRILLSNKTYQNQLQSDNYTGKLAKITRDFTAFKKSELAL